LDKETIVLAFLQLVLATPGLMGIQPFVSALFVLLIRSIILGTPLVFHAERIFQMFCRISALVLLAAQKTPFSMEELAIYVNMERLQTRVTVLVPRAVWDTIPHIPMTNA